MGFKLLVSARQNKKLSNWTKRPQFVQFILIKLSPLILANLKYTEIYLDLGNNKNNNLDFMDKDQSGAKKCKFWHRNSNPVPHV